MRLWHKTVIMFKISRRCQPLYLDNFPSCKNQVLVLTLVLYNAAPNATHILCLKKIETDVARYNFNAYQPSLVIFGMCR